MTLPRVGVAAGSFRAAAADILRAGFRPGVLDEEGARFVEDLSEVSVSTSETTLPKRVRLTWKRVPLANTVPLSRMRVSRTPSGNSEALRAAGRGASAFGVASHACAGVMRPGSDWCGRSKL